VVVGGGAFSDTREGCTQRKAATRVKQQLENLTAWWRVGAMRMAKAAKKPTGARNNCSKKRQRAKMTNPRADGSRRRDAGGRRTGGGRREHAARAKLQDDATREGGYIPTLRAQGDHDDDNDDDDDDGGEEWTASTQTTMENDAQRRRKGVAGSGADGNG
jgi:hypothetical protein